MSPPDGELKMISAVPDSLSAGSMTDGASSAYAESAAGSSIMTAASRAAARRMTDFF